jgi:hypothetical protein
LTNSPAGQRLNYEDHCIGMGRLWGKLQSLELTLRLFLTQANQPESYIPKRAGSRTLVNKYNGQLSKDERSLYSVDTRIVDIRNAIAHGLIVRQYRPGSHASDWSFPLTLLDDVIGQVDMTMEWFERQQSLAQKQIDRISACGKKRWASPWWG